MQTLARPFEDFLITPVNDGPFFVDELFQRKFGHAAPDFGHAVVGFYRKNRQQFIPLSFLCFIPHEEVLLVGGGMTDGSVFAQMQGDLGTQLRKSGGALYHMLKFGFNHYKDQCEAFFGHAGDPRAYEVDMRAGFEPTQHEHLIAHFHKPVSENRKQVLIEKIHAIGSF
jgi:hypothetical protein